MNEPQQKKAEEREERLDMWGWPEGASRERIRMEPRPARLPWRRRTVGLG